MLLVFQGAFANTNPRPLTLDYTGNAQDLITAGSGSSEGYAFYYCVEAGDVTCSEELPSEPNWTTTVPQGTDAGEYKIHHTYSNGIKKVSTNTGSVTSTIVAAPATVKWYVDGEEAVNIVFEYNYQNQAPTAKFTGIDDEEIDAIVNVSKADSEEALTEYKDAGRYKAIATAENYQLENSEIEFTINPKLITFTWNIKDGEEIVYDGEDHGWAQVEGIIDGDEEIIVKHTITSETEDESEEKLYAIDAGKYKIAASIDSGNYQYDEESETNEINFEITPKEVEIIWTPEDTEFIYDGKEKTYKAAVNEDDLVPGDETPLVLVSYKIKTSPELLLKTRLFPANILLMLQLPMTITSPQRPAKHMTLKSSQWRFSLVGNMMNQLKVEVNLN